MLRRLKHFLKDQRGAASLEYIVLLLPLLAMVFVSFQIALAYHFALTAQKAVELGARIAAVRDPVYTDLPPSNGVRIGGTTGVQCAVDNQCDLTDTGPWTCSGDDLGNGVCDADAYADIFEEVARIAYLLDPSDLSITYYYGELGFAGGPFVPIVEVAIEERPFFLQFFFNLAVGNPANGAEELQLPAVAASAIAEDLSSRN
ncbi:MAG: TadE/TadG family type IV pilus assembly protein [Pseudomonadota bacterium]